MQLNLPSMIAKIFKNYEGIQLCLIIDPLYDPKHHQLASLGIKVN